MSKKHKGNDKGKGKKHTKDRVKKKANASALVVEVGGVGAVSAADDYDPTGTIHEAVLAAAKIRQPRLRLKKTRTGARLFKSALNIEQILGWADSHHERTDRWPNTAAGVVYESPEIKWNAIASALKYGFRGLPGGTTLCSLLYERRAAPIGARAPDLTYERILQWADAFHERTQRWPSANSGAIPESRGDTWASVSNALTQGLRGLPPGKTLAGLLEDKRGKRNRLKLPDHTEAKILEWADAYRQRTNRWPTANSGPVDGAREETWNGIDMALRGGLRGLAAGSSLTRLLEKHRGERNVANLPKLEVNTILDWADAHFARHQSWPTQKSGPIPDAPGEVWANIEAMLLKGSRGLPGADSLARLLNRHRSKRNRQYPPPLDIETILSWADAYFSRTKRWPTVKSGPIPESPGETWRAVYLSLYVGRRGLAGKSSLARLLEEHRGVPVGSSRR